MSSADEIEIRELEVHLSAAGRRVDSFLAGRMQDYSRAYLQKLIDEGAVRVEGLAVRRSYRVSPGELIELEIPRPRPCDVEPQDLPLDIVYQDEDLLVVNKEAGVVVHPNTNDREGTLVNALLFHVGDLSGINGVERPGIVHRIDKDTSGLLVVAKHDRAHRALSDQFRDHSIDRMYVALCWGEPFPEQGTVETVIGRHTKDRRRMSARTAHGKHAVTHYRVVERYGPVSMAVCVLETGRTHQIRVHFAEELRHPLVGDPVYGGLDRRRLPHDPTLRRLLAPIHGQMLHAATLGFVHPGTERYVHFVRPPPPPMLALIRALRERAGLDPDGPGPWSQRGAVPTWAGRPLRG